MTPLPKRPRTTQTAPRTSLNNASLQAEIAHVAYGLFEQSGYEHGRDIAHWLQAETMVQRQLNGRRRRA